MIEKLKTAVWAKGQKHEKNRSFIFVLDLNKTQKGEICISASSCYKLIADGKLIGFGPSRAAHGFCRVNTYSFTSRYIAVEVHSHYVKNFCWVKCEPFFACVLETEDGREYFAEDFNCYTLADRVQKVQRYSFQRGFTEVYVNSRDRSELYLNNPLPPFSYTETEEAALPRVLPSFTVNPTLNVLLPASCIDSGIAVKNADLPIYIDRSETQVGTVLEGFLREEWQAFPSDDISRLSFVSEKIPTDNNMGKKTFSEEKFDYLYKTYDFLHIVAGITELEITAENAGEIYATFDEILEDDELKTLNPFRGSVANAFKWTVKKAGVYALSTFEPYAFRYLRIINSAGIIVKVKVRAYENPEANKLVFSCEDKRVENIMEAARRTFAHNAVDLLTDCPSRERGGWLSDSYFSSVAERVFTGDNKVERAFLQNYVYADRSDHPRGMIPRCYPADYYEKDGFIPNWAMWYILEIYKYYTQYGADETVESARANVEGILEYFAGAENEYGVLEDLKGWVFIEWSEANNPEHIAGINVPSNACYYATLLAADEIYNIAGLKEKALKIKDFLFSHAFVDGFFVDNLVRNKNGEPVPTEYYTETCQYYMFFFRCADKTTHGKLFEKMIDLYGKGKNAENCSDKKQLAPSNMIYGVYMRLELLMREGRRKDLFEECMRYFYGMAEKTGTLWENLSSSASCDHGFASYVSRFIIYALFGFDVLAPDKGSEKCGIGLNAKAVLPFKEKEIILSAL